MNHLSTFGDDEMRLNKTEKAWIELLIDDRLRNIARQIAETTEHDDAMYIIQKTADERYSLVSILEKIGA